jgi:hypothetical protein
LFNDHYDSLFFGRFDAIASRVGWQTLLSGEGPRKVYDPGEKKDELSDFGETVRRNARLTGKFPWHVL